jgi:16S rRNA (guanine(966)-N(2))-methyltransferase RsmD
MPNKPANRRPRNAPARQVRIIGGVWKRTPLPVPDAEGLRPTPDRVRETVFNWLNHLLDGAWTQAHCLDLFAGTGALGFEAASRGAAGVVMVEASMPAVRQLEATKGKLRATQVDIMHGDALPIAQRLAGNTKYERFDVIFVDPPYYHGWLAKILPACAHLLKAGGLVYAESETALDADDRPAWLESWEVLRSDQAGMVHYHLLRRKNGQDFEA